MRYYSHTPKTLFFYVIRKEMICLAKEFTCEVLKEYGSIELDGNTLIKVVEVKWNGRQPKGYDIRRYSKEDERLTKGITIPYDSVEDLVDILVSNNLCKIDKIEKIIKKRKDSMFTTDDFMNMFEHMNDEMTKYKRDKYGHLRDKDNRIVIASRRKKGR